MAEVAKIRALLDKSEAGAAFHYHDTVKCAKKNFDSTVYDRLPKIEPNNSGPTYRLGSFLDSLLKPVVQRYCKGELIKDSTEFLRAEEDGF